MSRVTRDGMANPSRETTFPGAEADREKKHIPCSADHEQDWQPYRVDPYSAVCVTIDTVRLCFIFFITVCMAIHTLHTQQPLARGTRRDAASWLIERSSQD